MMSRIVVVTTIDEPYTCSTSIKFLLSLSLKLQIFENYNYTYVSFTCPKGYMVLSIGLGSTQHILHIPEFGPDGIFWHNIHANTNGQLI